MCYLSLFPRYLAEFVCADGTSAGGERSRVGSSGASGDGKAGSGEGKQKLRAQMEDLEEQLARKRRQAASALDTDLKTIQCELFERNKVRGGERRLHTNLRQIITNLSVSISQHLGISSDSVQMQYSTGEMDEVW